MPFKIIFKRKNTNLGIKTVMIFSFVILYLSYFFTHFYFQVDKYFKDQAQAQPPQTQQPQNRPHLQ